MYFYVSLSCCDNYIQDLPHGTFSTTTYKFIVIT
jgi:hypothetical protein